ncbi:methionyl-tRNA formyltransferase [Roseiconus nitratireducens]|uniref:Methionyl-tRNA formyltransferase n=2 Tax=Roseiconus nitratireducens TaxID=2605748 RepID=A0A5M6CXG6_9BACT|nr:methionyl-tRNA formyltransferase [Roseiconus nitratireducens]
MGTGPFAVPTFDAICSAGHEVALVVTKPEPPVKSRKGPPPAPVRQWAVGRELPVFDPENVNDVDAVETLNRQAADLLVVCDYGRILKPEVLESSTLGGINLHGSLLPAYRGAAPVQRALLSGDRETGVSVIHITPRLDAGPVLGQQVTEIRSDETAGELEERLADLGVALTLECIDQLSQWDGQTAIGTAQEAAKVSKAPRLSKSEAAIDWNRTSREIDCHVRGMQPWPVAFAQLAVRPDKPPLRLAILQVSPADCEPTDLSPGQIVDPQEFTVATQDGSLRIDRLRPAGKREMTGQEFVRGHQLSRGTSLS